MPTFSNPRLTATFTDWPLGGDKRGQCVFKVESGSRGIRVSRVTTGKPKYSIYGGKAAIVDGDDGKTYILHLTLPVYGPFIKIMRHDFMDATPGAVFNQGD